MSSFSETAYLRAPVKARMLPINRQIAQISIDFALALTAWLTAYVARFNFDLPAMQPYLHFESITVLRTASDRRTLQPLATTPGCGVTRRCAI